MNKRVAVIGAGTMGNGIAHVFAMFGCEVNLVDFSPEALDRGLTTIQKNLQRMVDKEKISEADMEATLGRLSGMTELGIAVDDVDVVVEAIFEDLEVKSDLFSKIGQFVSDRTILASNTSSISIAQLGEASGRPEQFIGMHFMNPVPLMKLVEVIKSQVTAQWVVDEVVAMTEAMNKIPVVANDKPGFVANRILMPMLNEAIFTLNEGVAGVAEIDDIMKLGMAHPMGPLQLADYIGLDVCLNIINVLYDGFDNEKYAPCSLLKDMVAAGELGVKSGSGFYQYEKGRKELVVADRFS